MSIYFISDLHLHDSNPTNTKMLVNFLRSLPQDTHKLYILGDLFSLYLGDDLSAQTERTISAELANLSRRGIEVYFMPGNRDFLLDGEFCNASGCRLLLDPTVVKLDDQRVLLTHGDRFCTKDTGYQIFRLFVQNRLIKWFFLHLPKMTRTKLGLWIKGRSNRSKPKLKQIDESKYDVVDIAVEAWIRKHRVNVIVHGHTHKHGVHDHNGTTRYVLGEWTPNSAQVVRYNAKKFEHIDIVLFK